jgi:hypothetical protein
LIAKLGGVPSLTAIRRNVYGGDAAIGPSTAPNFDRSFSYFGIWRGTNNQRFWRNSGTPVIPPSTAINTNWPESNRTAALERSPMRQIAHGNLRHREF